MTTVFVSERPQPPLSWKPDALDKRGKPLIRSQGVEGGFDVEQGHLPVPRLDRLLEPLECAICLSKSDLHESHANRRCGARLRDVAHFVEYRSRLALAPRASERVTVWRQYVRATPHEPPSTFQFLDRPIGHTSGHRPPMRVDSGCPQSSGAASACRKRIIDVFCRTAPRVVGHQPAEFTSTARPLAIAPW